MTKRCRLTKTQWNLIELMRDPTSYLIFQDGAHVVVPGRSSVRVNPRTARSLLRTFLRPGDCDRWVLVSYMQKSGS